MTDTQELNELYEIMVEIGIWEDTHLSQDEHGWGYTDEYEFRGTMAEHHALHIARGIAEEWLKPHLQSRTWQPDRPGSVEGITYYRFTPNMCLNSLPAALRYANSSSNP